MPQDSLLDFDTAYANQFEHPTTLRDKLQQSLLSDELRGFANATEYLNHSGSYNPYSRVKQFHKAFKHPVGDKPQEMKRERREKRFAWMLEEIDEFKHADNLIDQIDALIDTLYLTYGTLVEMGVNPAPYFEHVHNANMSKLNSRGEPTYNSEGKVAKPEGWRGPEMDIARTLVTESVHRFLENPAFGTLDIHGMQELKRRYDKMQSAHAENLREVLEEDDKRDEEEFTSLSSGSVPVSVSLSISPPPHRNL